MIHSWHKKLNKYLNMKKINNQIVEYKNVNIKIIYIISQFKNF